MAKRRRAASYLSLLLLLAAVSQAPAQVTVDVSKISCEQFLYYKITDPQHIAIWLSGYYQARAASTVVDTQALNNSAEKLKEHCRLNLKQPVLQAAETLFGAGKN
jgi:acid stress chaperone HdeB